MEPGLCVSYPKSGRTWLRVMLAELGIPMEFTHLDAGADKASWGKPFTALAAPAAPGPAVVFLHRDPRDTVVSYFHQMTRRQPLPFGRKLRFTATGRMPPGSMDAFVRSTRFGIEKTVVFNLNCAEKLAAHPITYEALMADTEGVLTGVLAHLGCDVPRRRIAAVAANNTFAHMHAREARGELAETYGNKLRPLDPGDPNSFKVRRGKIGGWRDEMEPHTQDFTSTILSRYRYFERIRELTELRRLADAPAPIAPAPLHHPYTPSLA
jgi:hypothetical protein